MKLLRALRSSRAPALLVAGLAAPACSLIAGLGDYHHDTSTGGGSTATGGGGSTATGSGGQGAGSGGHGAGTTSTVSSTSTGTGGGTCNPGGVGGGGTGGAVGGGDAIDLSAGEQHVCAVRSDHKLYCWGSNQRGELGLPKSTVLAPSAVQVDAGGDVQQVATGAYHTCAILTGGGVSCWGADDSGATGATSLDSFAPPAKISSLLASQIIAGYDFSCAILSGGKGDVSCWGNNDLGSLGTSGAKTAKPTPTGVTGATAIATCPTCATACALVGTTVWCWGGDTAKPAPVNMGVTDAQAVAVGSALSYGSATDETVFILHAGGALDYTRRDSSGVFAPTTPYATGVAKMSVSGHVVAVDDAAEVLSSDDLQSGMPPPALGMNLPPPPTGFVEIVAGDGYDCARTPAGVYCTGYDEYGYLGNGKAQYVLSAAKVASCVERMSEGPACTTIELPDGSFRGFGECQAFTGDGGGKLYPTPLSQLASTVSLVRTGPATSKTGSTIEDQRAYFYDSSADGFVELSVQSQVTPTDIPMASDYVDIVLGEEWDFARHANGEAELTAVVDGADVHGLFGSASVAKGYQRKLTADGIAAARWADHVCTWKSGVLQCWGKNDTHQAAPKLGMSDVTMPTTVPIANVTQAVVGSQHTCALAGGKVFCWGDDSIYQLGSLNPITGTNGTVQIKLPSSNPVTKLASGATFTCAYVDADAKVYCWGENEGGECGNGTLDSPASPRSVVGMSGPVADLEAGQGSSCALLKNGDVYCWGASGEGEVGNGSSYFYGEWQAVVGF